MRVVENVPELRETTRAERARGRRVALVPTMGALHDGHMALVDEARRRADFAVVSIFVNPTQFGPDEDLAAYPRSLSRDLERCRASGVDVVFLPRAAALYPEGAQTWVSVEELARPLCGRSRPTHFRGVATVVTKLLLAAEPHVACFGEKDFQQLAVVRRLTRDLLMDVEVVGVPIVREPDGLALSSRNLRLSAEARAQATVLPRALAAAEALVAAGERRSRRIEAAARLELMKAPLARVDYAELRDAESLAPAPEELAAPALLALAVSLPSREGAHAPPVRLIDNRVLHPQPRAEDSP